MKEVYVITRGSYSDYGIDCIFTDLEKANKYVELQNNSSGEEYRIETYPLDEVDFDSVKIIEVKAKKVLNKDKYDFNYKIIDVVDERFNIYRTRVNIKDYSYNQSSQITLRRKFKGDEVSIVSKYRKVIEDYFFMVEANWDFYKTYEGKDLVSDAIEKDIDKI